MKKSNEQTPVLVFQDKDFENKVRQQLETAKQLLQGLLDLWNKLDIGCVPNINELLMHPEQVYNNAINNLVAIPEARGKFSVNKEKYLQNLDLPDTSQLYQSAKAVRQQSFCAIPELWGIKDNQVVINESEAHNYINAMNIYAEDPQKIRLAKDISKLCELLNSLNHRCNNEILPLSPWTYNFFRGKFNLQDSGNCWTVSPNPESLRKWLQSL